MSNNNVTVAIPGRPDWAVWWSPQSGFENFQLDIVGFLAVLGEDSVKANAQVAALSWLFLLPRLLPAPQALLPTQRPTNLPTTTANVTGVYSGNVKEHLHHIAGMLYDEPQPKYSVACVEITKDAKKLESRGTTRIGTFFRGEPQRVTPHPPPEPGIELQERTSQPASESHSEGGSTEAKHPAEPPVVRGKAAGPMFWVTLIGFAEVVILFICSIVFGDGMSLLATILLGGLSSIAGISNKWTVKLSHRSPSHVPQGDVVIRYPKGSFLVVKCKEDVARELYFAPEEIDYHIKSSWWYMTLSLTGTIMLMLGIIALANAKLQLQLAWAGAFIIINICHWYAAALPQKRHWDLTGYKVDPQPMKGNPLLEEPIFTQALWKAIYLTGSIDWVKNNKAAPSTPVWNAWLDQAKNHLVELNSEPPTAEEWDPKTAWDRLNDAYKSGKV